MTRLRLRPEMEAAIRELPGVRAASVITDEDARPVEIHLVADPARSAKQVVRDVQTLALAGFSLEVDYRVVSVVQIDAPTERAPTGRPALSALELRVERERATARVTLHTAAQEYPGEASDVPHPSLRALLVARATAEAVAPMMETHPLVEQALVDAVGPVPIAVVTVFVDEQRLVGTALVRVDDMDAVARATLDALNRKLER